MSAHPVHVVPKGTIRRILNRTRSRRVLNTPAGSMPLTDIATEMGRIPVYTTEAGLAELADIMRPRT